MRKYLSLSLPVASSLLIRLLQNSRFPKPIRPKVRQLHLVGLDHQITSEGAFQIVMESVGVMPLCEMNMVVH